MSKSNIFNIVLILIIVIGGVYWYLNKGDYKAEYENLVKKQDSINAIREVNTKRRDSVIYDLSFKNDSLKNRADKIKYIRYEKRTYIDRDIDSAIIVLSNYKYDTRTGSED